MYRQSCWQMKIFHCDHCGHLLFFENTNCVSCGHAVAYLPDLNVVGSLDVSDEGTWSSPLTKTTRYRLCRNYTEMRVCNWAVATDDPSEYCPSCRLTELIPDVSQPDAHEAWYRLEVAKRRLVFTLLSLKLPIANREEDPEGGLAFQFK